MDLKMPILLQLMLLCLVYAGNPYSQLNTIWLNNGVYFGLRVRQDDTNLLWGDVELKKTSVGKEYLEFTGNINGRHDFLLVLLIIF